MPESKLRLRPRKPKLNPSVFRPGDLFLVKEPVLVSRCGYPISRADAEKHVTATMEAEIKGLFARLGAEIDAEKTAVDMKNAGVVWFDRAAREVSHWDMKRVVGGLASHWLKLKGFGGNVRSLHTFRDDSLKPDMECQVISRKTVKTGTRYPATSSSSGGYDYPAEYDYEPGGLDDCQTHVLLEFRPVCGLDWIIGPLTATEDWDTRLWIEAKNVTKTYDSATNQRICPITQKPLDRFQSF
jgi:hypothetical protein